MSPKDHRKATEALANGLRRSDVYRWLVAKGYYPESYVLPPCFYVASHPRYGKRYFPYTARAFKPKIADCLDFGFPRTELTDRTFGIVDPEIHSDIALTIAQNWKTILAQLFHRKNLVVSYSFPIPLNAKNPGAIGDLRSGRLIYEFIEMAESDIAAISHRYTHLFKTDIKNFYPSIYTHSIAWAIHGKRSIRKLSKRFDYRFFGNRLDKLFQNACDGRTNGIPIGPAVSDVISELILAGVDRILSESLSKNVLVVRFKDDYLILARSTEDGRATVKSLQFALKQFHLELNEEKTKAHELPDGIFRAWVSRYYAVNPNPKKYYRYKRFRETYLSVVEIDRQIPGSGVIDRFLADIVTRKNRLRVRLSARTLPRIISLLLMLGNLRSKAFPKVLAIIESILQSRFGKANVLKLPHI